MKQHSKLIKIIFCVILSLCLIGGIAVFVIKFYKKHSDSAPVQVVEVEPAWGSDDDQDRRDSYLAHEISLAASDDLSEAFEAKLALASYYIEKGDLSQAASYMQSINTSEFSTEDYYRYYLTYQSLAEKQNNTAKAAEYAALAEEYLNTLRAESEAANQ